MNLAELRRSYSQHSLDVPDVLAHPAQQFRKWFEEAVSGQILEPNAMTLATVAPNGRPAARVVLLKGFDEKGFVFFTNYQSRKGAELDACPQAALLFCWLELERQVRIEGVVAKISREDSEAYFVSRPKGSQIGAWASPQSQPIANRAVLESAQAALEMQYNNADVLPIPPYWGGYILQPDYFEFWQGRESRLHDRVSYRLKPDDGSWDIVRLAP